jgi:hypothetical protein
MYIVHTSNYQIRHWQFNSRKFFTAIPVFENKILFTEFALRHCIDGKKNQKLNNKTSLKNLNTAHFTALSATRKNSRGFSLCNFLRIGEYCSCPHELDELADIATEWGRGLRGPRGTRPITNPVGRGGIGDTDAADDSEDSFRLKSWPKRTSRAEITVYILLGQ